MFQVLEFLGSIPLTKPKQKHVQQMKKKKIISIDFTQWLFLLLLSIARGFLMRKWKFSANEIELVHYDASNQIQSIQRINKNNNSCIIKRPLNSSSILYENMAMWAGTELPNWIDKFIGFVCLKTQTHALYHPTLTTEFGLDVAQNTKFILDLLFFFRNCFQLFVERCRYDV